MSSRAGETGSRWFPAEAGQAAFLLGGIGTGNVSVGARGELRDWEIFNNPGKGTKLPYTFFAIWMKQQGAASMVRVLESRLRPPFAQSHGFRSQEVAGLPRFADSRLRGEYPFVWVELRDPALPVAVTLEAFTPFIPLNADDSGIPAAVIRYTVANVSDRPVEMSVVGSLANASSYDGFKTSGRIRLLDDAENEYREEGDLKGIFLRPKLLSPTHRRFGNLALLTRDLDVTAKESWLPASWYDHIQDFWDDFRTDGRLEMHSKEQGIGGRLPGTGRLKVGSIGPCATVPAGGSHCFEFVLSWYFPNRPRCWDTGEDGVKPCEEIVRNYYATRFRDAWDAGRYLFKNLERLERSTRDFHRALFTTTVPGYVLDAVSANITVLRSNTCFRIEDGTFLGWEGCRDTVGCCEGSCTHVWNYAQTVAFLFPELERSMRRCEFNRETDEHGNMAFRGNTIFGLPRFDFLPATDGQLGTIVRLYRDWKFSGDDEFLKSVWANASRALDFAFGFWDRDGDKVLDSEQHNTYDIEFHGPNSLSNSVFFAALAAGREMALHLGDRQHAAAWQAALEEGSARMDAMLWNGEYYVQKLEDVNEHRYQYGTGCLADQLLGQFLAHVAGLGHILPREHVKSAIASVFRHNFKRDFSDHQGVQRTYALNDERGLLLCSWPNGGRPRFPFIYADEVWTGVEYQVAAHLIYEGFVPEGLAVVEAIRERHDGYRRNPWNEVECGHHYARAMASWALLTALGGYTCDLVNRCMGFDPRINAERFSTFFSTGQCWGIYQQERDPKTGEMRRTTEVLYGTLGDIRVSGTGPAA